MRPLLFANM